MRKSYEGTWASASGAMAAPSPSRARVPRHSSTLRNSITNASGFRCCEMRTLANTYTWHRPMSTYAFEEKSNGSDLVGLDAVRRVLQRHLHQPFALLLCVCLITVCILRAVSGCT